MFQVIFHDIFWSSADFFQVFKKKKKTPTSPWTTLPKFYEIKKFEPSFWQESVPLLSPIILRNSKCYSVCSWTVRLAMALIRLRVCTGWSEPLLVSHTTLLEIFIWTIHANCFVFDISDEGKQLFRACHRLNTISTVAFTTLKDRTTYLRIEICEWLNSMSRNRINNSK